MMPTQNKDFKSVIKVRVIFILLFIILYNCGLRAQEFNATVDKTTVGQSERFQVYFTFSGADINNLKNFQPPSFSGFRILGGPSQSSSMQIINGKVTASLTYSYILQASDIGEFTIGSSAVEYQSKTYKTDPIKITVIKGTSKPDQAAQSGGVSEEELAKNVFILALPDKRQAYKGEQITVTYKLYTRLNISSPQITKLPTYNGFWAEELDQNNNISFNIEMYKGERYRAATIKKVALFPTKTGVLLVTPFELKIPVLVKTKRSRGDIFDEFFNDSFFGRTETIEYLAKSNTVNIDITPLPSQNVPESFNGAVGNFNFKAEIDKQNVEVNEAVTLKITASGKGNIKLLDLPAVKLPAGFEKYEPKTSENISRAGIVSGQKIIEYLIVPRVPGSKQIDPLEFTYFDLSKKKYITNSSPAFNINVKKGEGVFESAISGYSKEDVKLLSEDVRFIKTSTFDLMKKGEYSLVKSWFWVGALLPLIFLLCVLGLAKRHDKLSGNLQLLKYQRAEKAARSKLKIAKKALDGGDNVNFYSELSQALFGYLEDKLALQKSEFTVDKVLMELNRQDVTAELTEKVKLISEKCEFARFAPEGENNAAAQELYTSAVKVIVELENSIIAKKK